MKSNNLHNNQTGRDLLNYIQITKKKQSACW